MFFNLCFITYIITGMQVDGTQLDQMSAAEYTCLAALPSHPNVVALLATVGPAPLTPAMAHYLPPAIKEITEVMCCGWLLFVQCAPQLTARLFHELDWLTQHRRL